MVQNGIVFQANIRQQSIVFALKLEEQAPPAHSNQNYILRCGVKLVYHVMWVPQKRRRGGNAPPLCFWRKQAEYIGVAEGACICISGLRLLYELESRRMALNSACIYFWLAVFWLAAALLAFGSKLN